MFVDEACHFIAVSATRFVRADAWPMVLFVEAAERNHDKDKAVLHRFTQLSQK